MCFCTFEITLFPILEHYCATVRPNQDIESTNAFIKELHVNLWAKLYNQPIPQEILSQVSTLKCGLCSKKFNNQIRRAKSHYINKYHTKSCLKHKERMESARANQQKQTHRGLKSEKECNLGKTTPSLSQRRKPTFFLKKNFLTGDIK